jgi:uncharacterized membrane protein HdeD (DUF308 family)
MESMKDDEHKQYLLWEKKRKHAFWILFLRLPLVLAIFILIFTNFIYSFYILGVCALIYYWVEVGEKLEECHLLTKGYLITMIVTGASYITITLVASFFNIMNLYMLIGIAFCAYMIFRTYLYFVRAFKHKQPTLFASTAAVILGFLVPTILCFMNKIAFVVYGVVLAVFYEVFYNIAKFILERSDNNLIEVKKKKTSSKQKAANVPTSYRTFKRGEDENYKIPK